MSPIQNELGHSRVYSPDTEGISEIVSRNWCLPDGQVLFCWDSFFNGLLASIENPEAGREVVRAVLNGQLPNGLVPNFSGRGWGVSADRSQPPVGSLCVWKMYQRDPDIAFLKEVFPKLLKWHNWWFTARDGNNDGLLEWGSETGVLQNAKFESGLDDSPMFDTATMSGTHMMVDSVDLNALWAMDAEYLAKIAQVLGDHDEAAKLGDEVVHMVNQVNGSLWNPEVGAYCYRYWTPRLARHSVPLAQLVSSADGPGLHGDYFTGRNFDHLVYSRQDADINFNWTGTSPQTSLGKEDYSVRWTANISAKQSADYIFKTYADDGVRVWIDVKQIIDDWKVHGTNETDSAPVSLEAGATHEIKIEYFQAAGDAVCRLEVEQLDKDSPAETFYNRLSPLNFYPMAAGVPTPDQAKAMRDILFRSKKFEGDYMCPTIERDDPAFPQQGYWRGTIWGPTNYLLYQGLRRYCTDAERNEFAKKSVALFMKNWNADGTCHENFNAMTGEGRSDPHYTWGALLCLIGIEDLCDIEPNGKLRLNGASGVHIEIKNFRLGGKTFDLRVEPNRAELRLNGHLFFDAKGKAAEMGMSAAS
jgi:glycogen debranching enzyme